VLDLIRLYYKAFFQNKKIKENKKPKIFICYLISLGDYFFYSHHKKRWFLN
jgi:hypothetical protein